ncbi:archease [Kitasatospora sp. NPDC056138]|uniref:archease n=1 Tax=Kitasatospora sp. NPDC056138 TaxID=3345724 RepID=UPI0035DEC76A
MNEVVDAAGAFDRDPEIGALVATGSEKAFAAGADIAGADIREMQALTFVDARLGDWFAAWDELGRLRKPVIAAVAGHAPGVGTGWCASRSRVVSLTPAYRARPDTGLPVRVSGSSLGEWGVPAVLRGQAAREVRGEQSPVAGQQSSGSGHRAVPHTADMRVEAWSPTVEGCIGEAVRAVVEGFADTSEATPVRDREYTVTTENDADLLVSVLEEVIYRMDADGEIPLDAQVGAVRDAAGGRSVSVRLRMADADTATLVGAVPKAVSLHDLRLQGDPGGWTCQVTLDV